MLEFELDHFMRWFLWVGCPHEKKRNMRCSGHNFEKDNYDDLVAHVTEAFATRNADVFNLRVSNAALRNKLTSIERKK